jgi:hypothetical protein
MFSKTSLVLTCLASAVFAQFPDVNPELVSQLKLAATHTDQISLLTDEQVCPKTPHPHLLLTFPKRTQFVFNFLGGLGETIGSGGKTVTANAATFPAIIGNGMAVCQYIPPLRESPIFYTVI